jgi:hypothetical protein
MPSVRHVELALYALCASGLVLWEALGVPWSVARLALVAHIGAGIVLMAAVVAPFWLRHRTRLRTSRRRTSALTGRAIEALLVALTVSGLSLFLTGNPGSWPGRIAHEAHLWLTFPLLLLLAVHIACAGALAPLWRALARRAPPRRGAA